MGATACGALLMLLVACASSRETSDPKPTDNSPVVASTTTKSARPPAQPSPDPISPESVQRVGTRLAKPARNAHAAVPMALAEKLAQREFSGMLAERTPAEAGLVTVTIPPDIDDRLCWAFIYSRLNVPVYGGLPPDQGGASYPADYVSDFLVLMDAETGKFIEAETLRAA